ncbi:flagellar biogenesis protein FliO [Azospirillum lipoferum]|uniref:DUF202 domain-containing protein n=1 Tax=Azospirillum lipoferum TaxID=193 RepID=A0A5A9GNM5_AZOLI|nr:MULTISPECIES: DUF202 domain-containing protein [Azospirillum]KAA0596041.1 DUF202 domain-containing protein [Azospirillum lipoferum]MCP1610964.1 flagellar biogenesis protein FliO [Azospirillum lipoferum]MDW5533900.1 DUF202 domain-containing protein [Azospirillum sp. NL1]
MSENILTVSNRDPGLQMERTSLAWFRTFAGMCTILLIVLRLRLKEQNAFLALALLTLLIFIFTVYRMARSRRVVGSEIVSHRSHSSFGLPSAIALVAFCASSIAGFPHISRIVLQVVSP